MTELWRETISQWRLKACFLALPFYVWPREYLKYQWRKLLGQTQADADHAKSNATIRWLSKVLPLGVFRAVCGSGLPGHSLIAECDELKQLGAESSEVTGSGFKATWCPKISGATHTILYVHGGGFVSGSSAMASKYLLQFFLELRHAGLLSDILAVDYDLSPEALYPTAVFQVIKAYEYAASLGKPIILIGDSAGGNLCLSLLQHLYQPHPVVASSVAAANVGDIIATCLVSPWVNLHTQGASVEAFCGFDCLDKRTLDSWAAQYLGKSGKYDTYNNPLDRIKGWSSILPGKTLLMAGAMELFLSDIEALAKNITDDGYGDLDLIISPFKGHDWPAVDFGVAFAESGPHSGAGVTKKFANGLHGLRMQVEWIAKTVLKSKLARKSAVHVETIEVDRES